MPIRMLRDWTDSEPVNSLDPSAEVLFVRLIMKADDYGRFTANAKLIRSLCYPLKDGIRESDISRQLAACEKAGLIATYVATGKPFLEIVNFNQRLRAKRSVYPPPESAVTCQQPADTCQQHAVTCQQSAAECGLKGREDEYEENSNTNTKMKSNAVAVAPVEIPPELQTTQFENAWGELKTYRAERKLKTTPTSQRQLLKKMSEWGPERAISAIYHSIANNWQGVFEPTLNGKQKTIAIGPGQVAAGDESRW